MPPGKFQIALELAETVEYRFYVHRIVQEIIQYQLSY